jgi:2-keto-4-pentenoate hydratase/2-oxohepta-3-ene-1,7-dioic acid hydratase in catechol pathway
MKLICVTPNVDKTITTYLMPDTTLVRNNEAFYIPNTANEIQSQLAFVIKISKLGKNIAHRFAHRYYDEISAGINFTAKDILEERKEAGEPWDEAVGFDRSCALGKFVKKNEELTLQLIIDEKISQQIGDKLLSVSIENIISKVSHSFTLKMGDLIFINLPIANRVKIGQDYYATLNGENILECSIM